MSPSAAARTMCGCAHHGSPFARMSEGALSVGIDMLERPGVSPHFGLSVLAACAGLEPRVSCESALNAKMLVAKSDLLTPS